MVSVLPYLQTILAVMLTAGILMQTSAAGLGGAFGDSDSVDAGLHTRRGLEKIVFWGTVIIAVLFVIVSFTAFITG